MQNAEYYLCSNSSYPLSRALLIVSLSVVPLLNDSKISLNVDLSTLLPMFISVDPSIFLPNPPGVTVSEKSRNQKFTK